MLKKYAAFLVSMLLLGCAATGCGAEKAEESTAATEPETTTAAEEETTVATTRATTAAPTTEAGTGVEYISERAVQYKEEDDVYQLMFALQNKAKKYTDASGTAEITVVDTKGDTVYNKTIDFSKSDFTNWTNNNRDDSTYGCWLEFPHSEIGEASSSSGTLTLSVYGKDYSFEPYTMTIYDLPQKQASLNLPATPASITDLRYHSHTSYVTVSDLTYESNNDSKGEMTITLKMVVTLDRKEGEENIAESAAVGYRLMDDEGFVIDTGTIYTEDMRVGDKCRVEKKIYDLDPSVTYSLTLENVT